MTHSSVTAEQVAPHTAGRPSSQEGHLHLVARAPREQGGDREGIATAEEILRRPLSAELLSMERSEWAHLARLISLGALTAAIAHEVSQPLSGIITNASTCLRMLAADPPDIHGACETARRTVRDGKRASDVIARLRVLFSNRDAVMEAVNLNEMTREIVAVTSGELQAKRVALQLVLADDLPQVTGDGVQLQQVILNLLLNAADAMSGLEGRPKELVIRTQREAGDRVRLSVHDNGVGLAAQGMERLFEPFYTTKSGGMGIGLAVSRSIVESHRGCLWAEPNEGPGATFSFSIPSGPRDVPTRVNGADGPGRLHAHCADTKNVA